LIWVTLVNYMVLRPERAVEPLVGKPRAARARPSSADNAYYIGYR